jgi:2-polyprenyl-3-methyl-5-hydroxy-6-metoxy-1,4-benzoquinol methylase
MELTIMGAHHYEYSSGTAWQDSYIASRIVRILTANSDIRTVLDAGCGNGNLSARLRDEGLEVCGFDASSSGIDHARHDFPDIHFEVASGYDNLSKHFDLSFDACVCIEVIEHVYDPRTFVRRIGEILRPGGLLVLSTPYHGYLKNLALALTGSMDAHYSALWDGGHIKFWSRATLATLLSEAGFAVCGFEGAGRFPLMWKSMIMTARKS